MKRSATGCKTILLCLLTASSLVAADWPRFRGPDGSGISADTKVPIRWSESNNLKWKTPLPGPGSSSPIIWGQHVYVTCYSGYGVSRTNPGNMEQLKRHLLCIDRNSGTFVFAARPEFEQIAQNRFPSDETFFNATPAICDGELFLRSNKYLYCIADEGEKP